MHARHLLLNRSSMPRLVEPAPTPADLELFEAAALRVPDHMSLTPYQVIVFRGEHLVELGDLFRATAEHEELGENAIERAASLPLRAPMILMVSTRYQEHKSVPRDEQLASAACAAHAIVQMAFTQGYGAVWRTGPYAESQFLKEQLGIAEEDILGFIYVGTPAVPTPIKPAKDKKIFFDYSSN
ncbi:nitroreductase [Aliidiomarina taiwanensis]|uniref:Putative NAD(P)H nitroreductase n=1 Tax=Aliidiomarina taiwanensis TaxID=946228 RepID=A0A432X9Z8_9GAMM|nr:nitroreductase family protein [Aliidiomarina taiwanensis]RUO44061.1 nitroreductase [Aliidiomarina taiwanensis]